MEQSTAVRASAADLRYRKLAADDCEAAITLPSAKETEWPRSTLRWLRICRCSRDLGRDELDEILREARSARYAKNSAIFEQGEDAHSFFLLLHGHVRASKTTPTGEQIVVRYVAPGETFGVAMAIGLARYPATATAVDDSVVLAWPTPAWPRLVEKFPALATNTLQTVGSRLQESHTRVVEMSTQQVEQRVAHALLRLAKQSGQARSNMASRSTFRSAARTSRR